MGLGACGWWGGRGYVAIAYLGRLGVSLLLCILLLGRHRAFPSRRFPSDRAGDHALRRYHDTHYYRDGVAN